MCTVTLEYRNTALARRKIAALSEDRETLEEHRQLRDAAMYTSHRNMERFIEDMDERVEVNAFMATSKRSMANVIARNI